MDLSDLFPFSVICQHSNEIDQSIDDWDDRRRSAAGIMTNSLARAYPLRA